MYLVLDQVVFQQWARSDDAVLGFAEYLYDGLNQVRYRMESDIPKLRRSLNVLFAHAVLILSINPSVFFISDSAAGRFPYSGLRAGEDSRTSIANIKPSFTPGPMSERMSKKMFRPSMTALSKASSSLSLRTARPVVRLKGSRFIVDVGMKAVHVPMAG
jgi:hypothetical protein